MPRKSRAYGIKNSAIRETRGPAIRVRVTPDEKKEVEEKAKAAGFRWVADWIRSRIFD